MVIESSKSNQLKTLDLFFTRVMISLVFWLGCSLVIKNLSFTIISLLFIILLALPTVYLHFEYIKFSKRLKIITDYHRKEFRVKTKSNEEEYSYSDIEKITVFATRNFYKNSTRFLWFEDYHFARIKLSSGVELISTCYMIFPMIKFLNQFEDVETEFKKVFFPSIFLCVRLT